MEYMALKALLDDFIGCSLDALRIIIEIQVFYSDIVSQISNPGTLS